MNNTDLIAALPLIILAGTGLVVMMWDAFEKTSSHVPLYLTVIGGLAAAGAAFMNLGHNAIAFDGLFFDNSFSNFFTIIFSAATVLTALLAEKYLQAEEVVIGEFSALTLFAACGMVMMASGGSLIVTFLGLETMSICFYIMAGMFRARAESNESALKYFLLGSFATGFFLYGIALVYGSIGTLSIVKIHNIILTDPLKMQAALESPLMIFGAVLIIIGLSFKVAAFPFHQWAPDVYEGAPTVVAGYMSTAGKAAAFSAFVLIFGYAILPKASLGYGVKIQTMIAVLAACSMLYGNIVAISQRKIKRMLAYSSTAHAGYILLGVAAMNSQGVTGIAIYTAVYTLMQIGAFGIVALLEKGTGGTDLDDYAGLAKREPTKALLLSVLMLSLAGIPPFAGFFGKYYLFAAALQAGMTWLVIVGVISSIIASYFYLRIIVLMYFRDSKEEVSEPTKEKINISLIAIGLASLGLLILGLLPDTLLSIAQQFFH